MGIKRSIMKFEADMVLTNGLVYTVNDSDTIVEAAAIKNGKITFLGSALDVKNYIGFNTQVVDLKGKMVIPGMIDSHIHVPGTKITELYNINLNGILTEKETMKTIESFIDKHPEMDIYYGVGFSIGAFSGEEVSMGPKKERLDKICRDKPIIITSYDCHTTWVNSKALEIYGITKNTSNPPGGIIEKHPKTGEPWGTLKEAAQNLVPKQKFCVAQKREAVKAFQTMLHSYGYTGILSVSDNSSPAPLEAYKALEEQNNLKLRVRASVTINPEQELLPQIKRFKQVKTKYDGNFLKVTSAKFFADGVVEGRTAYLLKPYCSNNRKSISYHGEFLWDMEKLKKAFTMANSEGIQIHVHSIGDASTRNVLKALEHTKQKVGHGDFRNTITHLQLVAPEDIMKFKKLGVIACVQPYWHFKEPGWWEVVDLPLLGKRAELEYPLHSFFKQGVMVCSSSDHPVTPNPNPFWAIKVGVTRNLSNAKYYGVKDIKNPNDPRWLLNSKEGTPINNMIRSFTAYGAYITFMDKQTGTLEVGKCADMVILDKNIFNVNPLDVDKIKVLKTIFNGKVVYEH